MMKIALTNLGKYNEGILDFTWLSLPATDEEIAHAFDEIKVSHDDVEYFDAFGCPYEEWFITDYECDYYEIGEYENISDLNDLADKYESLADYEQKIVKALLDDGCSFEEALDNYDNCFYYDVNGFTGLAQYQVDEYGLLDNMPDDLKCFFDYEAYGRYLDTTGNYIETDDGIVEKCF